MAGLWMAGYLGRHVFWGGRLSGACILHLSLWNIKTLHTHVCTSTLSTDTHLPSSTREERCDCWQDSKHARQSRICQMIVINVDQVFSCLFASRKKNRSTQSKLNDEYLAAQGLLGKELSKPLKQCIACSKTAPRMLMCSRCRQVHACSNVCFVQAWPFHKHRCVKAEKK